MGNKYILPLLVMLIVQLAIPVSATQYTPPWTHNYGYYYTTPPYPQDRSFDSRSYATYAANIQSIVGYNSYDLPGSGAYILFNNMKEDAVFFFSGHGGVVGDTPGGALECFNGTKSYIFAEDKGWDVFDDRYFLSSTTTELNDILLALYVGCHTGKESDYFGNLVDMSSQKGVDNVIGFIHFIYFPPAGYWSDRFWYRCLYGGQGGSHQSFKYAASGAVADVMIKYHGPYGLQFMYSKYSSIYEYLDPARYGVV